MVQRSFGELQRQADGIRNGVGPLSTASNGQVGIDVKTNRVVVAVPAAQLPGLLAAGEAADVTVIVDPQLHVEVDQCAGRDVCDGSIAAGAMLWRGAAGAFVCSIGFTAEDPFTLGRFVYTAGHCSNGNGVNWWTGAQNIGPMAASINSGVYDVSIIRVTNGWFTGDAGHEIYMDSVAGKTVPLNGVAPSVSYMYQGERVCLAANYTQPNGANLCGVIGAVSDSGTRGMTRVDGLDACPGDSGGGWYWLTGTGRRIAYGLHSRSDTGCHGSSGGSHSWYTPIASAKAWSGLNVEIAP